MAESWKTKLLRWRFNWYPAFRRTGARVIFISEDRLEVKACLPLNRATRNVHGTTYGGAMFAAVDPLHAVLVAVHLGPDYHVWMKSARIDFRRPGRSNLYAHARIHPQELDEIRAALAHNRKHDHEFSLILANAAGEVAAHVTVTLHMRRRAAHESPMESSIFP